LKPPFIQKTKKPAGAFGPAGFMIILHYGYIIRIIFAPVSFSPETDNLTRHHQLFLKTNGSFMGESPNLLQNRLTRIFYFVK
jgi:hypothetical protein